MWPMTLEIGAAQFRLVKEITSRSSFLKPILYGFRNGTKAVLYNVNEAYVVCNGQGKRQEIELV